MSKRVKSDLLVIAEEEKAKREAELVIAEEEKEKLAVELTIVNKELNLQINERKQSELALRETDNKYMGLANLIPVYIAYVNANTLQYEFVNDLYEKSFGIPREKIIGSHMQDVVGETNYQIALKYINEVKSGKSVSYENTLDIASGKRWIQVNYSPVFDDFSKVIGIAVVNYDITERKKAEEKLQKSEMLLESVINSSENLIIVVDRDLKVLMSNWKSPIYAGCTEFPIGSHCYEAFIHRDTPCEPCHVFSVFNNGKPIHAEYYNQYTKLFKEIEAYPIFDDDKNVTMVVENVQDITERKQIEKVLRENESSLRDAQKIAKMGSWEWDMVTQKTIWSDNYLAIHGFKYTEVEPTFELFRSRIHPDDVHFLDENLTNIMKDKIPSTFELRIIQPDGTFIWIQNNISPVIEEDKLVKLKGVIIDINEMKQAEFELIKAKNKAEESDRLKSAFLTNMSHEVRTPMNGIIGFTELLKEPHLTIEEQQDFIQTIQISGARMLNTINSIVDMSKIESGLIGVDIKETNLNEKIEFTYKFFKPEVENKGLQFFFKNGLTAKEANIKTDNEKVYGILTNLVRNAIKFTYEGSIEFGYEKKGEYLEFFVKDSGIGIPENQKEMIFERFRQGSESHNRGYEGSGLGLSISKSYVLMLGGEIWVESEEGKGSTFYFTIPYIPVSEETHTIENVVFTENKDVQIKKLKILIVEDDEISYSLLSRVVQKISKEVLHAITGVQAIEACRNNPDLDLVLMDIRMPEMNGLEATSQIRQFNKDLIIIAQTAYGFSSDSEKAMEAGCNDYISKPINKTLLFELIKKQFNR